MKGIVFNEFLRMVEEGHGVVVMDSILEQAAPQSGGVYTSVGTYDFDELVRLVVALHDQTGIPVEDLLFAFGQFLFGSFLSRFPELIEQEEDSMTLLMGLEDIIHAEVRKLYPDAQLPSFNCWRVDDDNMEMVYESPRRMSTFALGLIAACGEHFEEDLQVETEDLSGGQGEKVRFLVHRRG